MGYGKGGGGTTESYSKGHEDTTGTASSAYNKSATFNPEAQQTLQALSGAFGNVGQNGTAAANYYKSQLGNTSVNPYYEQLIAAQNKTANKQLADRMAQVRSGGYGGGVARDTAAQSQAAADFTAQQQAGNSNLLANAYNTMQQNQQQSAGGLAGLDANQTNSAINFLQTLRGESGTGSTLSTSRTNKYNQSLGANQWAEGGGSFGGS